MAAVRFNGSATGSNANRIAVWVMAEETQTDTPNNRSYVKLDFYTQVKPGYDSNTQDSTSHEHFTVNGTVVKDGAVAITYVDAHLNALYHWEGWVAHDANGVKALTFSGSFSTSSTYVSGGSVSGTFNLTVLWTNATSASNVSLGVNFPTTYLTLTFTPGVNGRSNAITRYDLNLEYDSGGSWVLLSTIISVYSGQQIDISSQPGGRIFRAKIIARTAYGDNPNSGYSSSVQKAYTIPTTPTLVSASPTVFETALRLSWAQGTSSPDNPITQYDVRYQISDDGVSWSGEVSVLVSSTVLYYDIPGATITGWTRGKYIRFRVGSVTAHADTIYSTYSNVVWKNRIPNTPIGSPTTNKSIYTPGDTIIISFTPPAIKDPDGANGGDISGYEVKMQDAAGVDYNGGSIIGSCTKTLTTINVYTTNWIPGRQWKFLVRGYDSYGVRGNWSMASDLIQIGVAMRMVFDGVAKTTIEHHMAYNGVLKDIIDIKIVEDGIAKNFIV